MKLLEKFGTLLAVGSVIVSVAVTFGIQMERLSRLRDDVQEIREQQKEVQSQQGEIMKAIGQMEHRRWRERR